MPDRPEIAETYDIFGPQFWNDLAEVTREARRHLNTMYRNWSTMDALTRNSLMGQVHVLTTIDIHERIKAICEPRGYLDEFEWDIALGVKKAQAGNPEDPQYNSRIITLYYWLLARYFYWLDRLGVLFRVAPPNLFAADILAEMRREAQGSRKKHRRSALVNVLPELSLPPPPPEDEHDQEVEDELELKDEPDDVEADVDG